MNIQEFQDKLKEIQTLAMKNGKQVQAELVEQFFRRRRNGSGKIKKRSSTFWKSRGLRCMATERRVETFQKSFRAREI